MIVLVINVKKPKKNNRFNIKPIVASGATPAEAFHVASGMVHDVKEIQHIEVYNDAIVGGEGL